MISDPDKVKRIAEHVGVQASIITPLGRGATSSAWKVTHARDAFIVRFMPVSTQRPVTYQSEFTILRVLMDRGCPVPKPVMTSVEANRPISGVPEAWAVTQVVPGEPVKNGLISSGVMYDLGRLLSVLHALPVTGFGRLVEQPDALVGQQESHLDGVRARWCWADLWPFDGGNLRQHPFAKRRLHLTEKLQGFEEAIFKVVSDEPVALTHSDLHGEHIFQRDGALSGVIDFGAAFIGVPAWDFAVIAFYHGWPTVQATVSGYTYPLGKRQLLQQTRMLALVVGLYKLSKAAKERASESKIERILQFLSRTLEDKPNEIDQLQQYPS